MSSSLHGQSLVGGQLLEKRGRSFQAVSPLDSQPLEPHFHECTIEEVDRTLQLADEAFRQYRNTTVEQRAVFIERIADEIMALGDALLDQAHRETGLLHDRLTGERGRTVNQLRLFAAVLREGSWVDARIDPAMPARQPLPRVDLRRMLIPLGPIIVFGSSNFPLAFSVAGGDCASALAAGNSVIIKAHRAHPGTSELVAGAVNRAVAACGMPAGVFSMLHGSGLDIGTALVRHPLARAAGFTGSRVAGRALFDAANARPDPIPVFAEMASLNPLFILPGALRERGAQLADGLKTSVTMGMGQFCTKPGLVFGIGGPDLQSFAATFAERITGTAPATMLHTGIHRSYCDGVKTISKVPGVVPLAQSGTDGDPKRTEGEPTVFATDAANFLKHRELHEEVFGPFTLLIDAPEMSDLVNIARELEGQLTATIHGTPEDLAEAGELIAVLERKAGRLIFNGFPTGVEVSPAMNHGGPYPATTDVRFTSVGTASLLRWVRPVCYQNFPEAALPPELQDANPNGIMRLVNNELTRAAIAPPTP